MFFTDEQGRVFTSGYVDNLHGRYEDDGSFIAYPNADDETDFTGMKYTPYRDTGVGSTGLSSFEPPTREQAQMGIMDRGQMFGNLLSQQMFGQGLPTMQLFDPSSNMMQQPSTQLTKPESFMNNFNSLKGLFGV
jgi:hypothetical protein